MDDTPGDLAAFGASAEIIESIKAATPDTSTFEVFQENWDAVEMFLRMSTQWNVSGMGGMTGLNYPALDILFKLYKVRDRKGMFEQVQIIEAGALAYLNDQREKG